MEPSQKRSLDFHRLFGQTVSVLPTTDISEMDKKLRLDLIAEEFGELEEAVMADDIVKIADALGDLIYVTYGAAVAFGIDMEHVEKEVHRSNLSKVIGATRREDGKVIKSPLYSPVNLEPILRTQASLDGSKVLVA